MASRTGLRVGEDYAVHPHHRFDQTTVNFAHRARFKRFLSEEFPSNSPLVFEMVEPGSSNLNSPKPGEEFMLPNAGKVWMLWETLQRRTVQFQGGMTEEQAKQPIREALAVLGITRDVFLDTSPTVPTPRSTQVHLMGREILELAERWQTMEEVKNG